jgi:hypothetical protein
LLYSEVCKYTHLFTLFSHLTWLSQKNRGRWKKTAYIFEFSIKRSIRNRYLPPCAKKKVKFCCPVKYVNIHIFSHLTWLLQKNVSDGEKLLTYLNSTLKVLSGLDIFPRGTKKKLNCVDQCNFFHCMQHTVISSHLLNFYPVTRRQTQLQHGRQCFSHLCNWMSPCAWLSDRASLPMWQNVKESVCSHQQCAVECIIFKIKTSLWNILQR